MKKNVYETPVVETVELMVESVLAASTPTGASIENSIPGLGE